MTPHPAPVCTPTQAAEIRSKAWAAGTAPAAGGPRSPNEIWAEAINSVLGGDQDRLTNDERAMRDAWSPAVVAATVAVPALRAALTKALETIDRLAPAPAPRDPVVALLDQWSTTAPDHAAALRAALAARGDAE